MERVCDYNKEVICDRKECNHCGWDPETAKARVNAFLGGVKYTVPFTGYCEVWANSPEEAVEKADNGDMYFVQYDFGEATCEEEDENEVDR